MLMTTPYEKRPESVQRLGKYLLTQANANLYADSFKGKASESESVCMGKEACVKEMLYEKFAGYLRRHVVVS